MLVRRLLTKAIFLVLLVIAFSSAEAQTTINAASCSESDVSSALNKIAANGTTVAIPAGNCTWTSPLNFSTQYTFTLQGQSSVASTNSQGNPATFTDATEIIDGQSGTGGNNPILSVTMTGSSTQVARVSGLSFKGGNVVYNGEVSLRGAQGQGRVDHCHFININDLTLSMYQPMSGVVDHSLFDAPVGSVYNGVRIYNISDAGYGDTPWTVGPGFGGSSFIFLENNTFNNGFMNDCELGGTFVIRYNTLNAEGANANVGFQSHATGSQARARGCRAFEFYKNVVQGVNGGSITDGAGFLTSGTGLYWGNTVSNSQHDLQFTDDRDNTTTYSQSAPPNGWGYCGTKFNGTGSSWDGNTNAATGYPCLDQVGRGQGDMLSGYWPKVQNNTSPNVYTGVWPHQVLQPVYIWMETYSGAGSLVTISSPNGNIVANQDYYAPATGFNGTSGTGYGAYASIPSTCTAGPGGNTSGVAYWATDQNKLYVCNPTNTWSVYYTPYAYPHPLVNSTPSAPTSLQGKAVAQ